MGEAGAGGGVDRLFFIVEGCEAAFVGGEFADESVEGGEGCWGGGSGGEPHGSGEGVGEGGGFALVVFLRGFEGFAEELVREAQEGFVLDGRWLVGCRGAGKLRAVRGGRGIRRRACPWKMTWRSLAMVDNAEL